MLPTPNPDSSPHDLPRLIEVLDRHGVEYLIVGGAAAYAYGAKRPTEDIDCVVRRSRVNLDHLAGALRELHARLRVAGMTDAEARALPVRIDATTLDMAGMSTWMTDAGPFDVLAGLESPDGRLVPYEELAQRATVLHGRGFTPAEPPDPAPGTTTSARPPFMRRRDSRSTVACNCPLKCLRPRSSSAVACADLPVSTPSET
jgi:hypothetical protein